MDRVAYARVQLSCSSSPRDGGEPSARGSFSSPCRAPRLLVRLAYSFASPSSAFAPPVAPYLSAIPVALRCAFIRVTNKPYCQKIIP